MFEIDMLKFYFSFAVKVRIEAIHHSLGEKHTYSRNLKYLFYHFAINSPLIVFLFSKVTFCIYLHTVITVYGYIRHSQFFLFAIFRRLNRELSHTFWKISVYIKQKCDMNNSAFNQIYQADSMRNFKNLMLLLNLFYISPNYYLNRQV